MRNFHKPFQLTPSCAETWPYADLITDLTENFPLGSRIQISLSSIGVAGILIFEIASADSASKSSCIRLRFQLLELLSIRSATLSGDKIMDGYFGFGVKLCNQGTQGSFQTSIDSPSPTKKHAPLLIRIFILSIQKYYVCSITLDGMSILSICMDTIKNLLFFEPRCATLFAQAINSNQKKKFYASNK
jgi:hypothetical protein